MRCLILGKVWPEPSSTAAGRHTLDLIKSLGAAGWELHFASTAQVGPHSLDLDALGVATHRVQVNDSGFDRWIQSLMPDVVIFDRFMIEEQFGWRVEQQCPEALRVLDTSDLHCLREARQQQLKCGGALNLLNDLALREIAAILRSDLTLMISEYEVALLQEVFNIPSRQIAYWPFGLDTPALDAPSFEARANFIMIGSFQHAPNLDAARWCKQHIWPLIRQALPQAELHCYGSYGERYAGELHAPKSGFHFKGRAQDALETMRQYRVNLAPLRFGAGLKGKLFDGFETSTPSVTTPISGSTRRGSNSHRVDFPEPVAPTSATTLPAGISMSRCSSTGGSSPWRQVTSSNLTASGVFGNTGAPPVASASRSLAITASSRALATTERGSSWRKYPNTRIGNARSPNSAAA